MHTAAHFSDATDESLKRWTWYKIRNKANKNNMYIISTYTHDAK